MTVGSGNDLEAQISEWQTYVRRRQALHHADAEELEDHLRSRITELTEAGLQDDEAFLIAVKRMGSLDDLSREFAREHSDRLWKQLVLPGEPDAPAAARARRELPVMLLCAVVAAVGIKLPALFTDDWDFYARNLGLFVLAPLAAYFAWQRRVGPVTLAVLAASFVCGGVAANAYPLAEDSKSLGLVAAHLPLALWLVVGVAYVGGEWRDQQRRMDFIRFTGEWAIYYALLALGGGALLAFTVGAFNAIGLDVEEVIGPWVLPCGAVGAVVVAAWLVEAKQSVVENMAPVLTRVFTPLFALTLLIFLPMLVWSLDGFDIQRDVLILFDLLLVIVLGLVLYSISARDHSTRPGLFDRLQLVLVVTALLIDAIVLVVMTARINEFGLTPNNSAALGENIVLLANLAWTAWLLLGFARGRTPFTQLDQWQTRYLPVYAAWGWIVVLIFPVVFGFK